MGFDSFPGERHRILRAIRGDLERHPIVAAARGHPQSTSVEVRADLAPERWGHEAANAILRVIWQPITPPEFVFHYSDDRFDCGWHHEPNSHVEGYAHYQARTGSEYEPVTFDGETPTELVWDVVERLRKRLDRLE